MKTFGYDLEKYKINEGNVGEFLEDCYGLIERVEDGNFGGWEFEDDDMEDLLYDDLYLVTSNDHICSPDKDGYLELKHLIWRGHEAIEADVPTYRCFPIDQSVMNKLISRCTKINKVLSESPKAPTDSIAPLKPTEPKQITETKEENIMSKVKAVATAAVASNKTAGLEAAKLKVGKSAVNLMAKMIKPKMPVGTKGFADHPLCGIVIANAAKIAVDQIGGDDNKKLKAISDAAMTYAYFELIDKIDVEGMLSDISDKFKGSAVEKIVKAQDDIVIDE